MKIDYENCSFIIVKGNTVTTAPYMGVARPNGLIEDLKHRRKRAQYVCALHDGDPINITGDVCEEHIEICLAAKERAKDGVLPEKSKRNTLAEKEAEKTGE